MSTTSVDRYNSARLEAMDATVADFVRVLSKHGTQGVLDGLPGDATQDQIMGRLVELGPGLPEDGDIDWDTAKAPTAAELSSYVAAAALLDEPHRSVLLARVRPHAYSTKSPHRTDALRALADGGDESAAGILEAERAEEVAGLQRVTHQMAKGCCGDH